MADFETVHTMTDYYDGPRGGIADFRGTPHVYESQFSDIDDDYSDVFHLSPIPQDVLHLALEDWAIWLRWQSAFHRGDTTQETHPALPSDRDRQNELKHLLDGKLIVDSADFIAATAEFRYIESLQRVRWSIAPPVA